MSHLRRLRAATGPQKILLAYASAVVCDESGRVLMQRRADFRDAWWGLPGGVLEPGETIAACAAREVEEETGLRVVPTRLTGMYSSPRYDVRYPNGDEVQQVTACFECRLAAGQLGSLESGSGEILECRFFDPAELPPMPVWYADMLGHAFANSEQAYFDPAELPIDDVGPRTRDEGRGSSSVPRPESGYIAWLRQLLGPDPIVHPSGAAIVRDNDGRILLVHRRDFGLWGLPTGAMDLCETLADAAVRVAREETGLIVRPLRLRAVFSGWRLAHPKGDLLDVLSAWFDCETIAGALRPDGRETLDTRYFSPNDLPPLVPGLEKRLARALALESGVVVE